MFLTFSFFIFLFLFFLINFICLFFVLDHFILILIFLDLLLLTNIFLNIFFSVLTNNFSGYAYVLIIFGIAAVETAIGLGLFVIYYKCTNNFSIKDNRVLILLFKPEIK
jgi:NADH:ubiquinone oxidoreductase subunit K